MLSNVTQSCPTVPGLHSAWHREQHRSDWRSLVETTTLQYGHATDDDDDDDDDSNKR